MEISNDIQKASFIQDLEGLSNLIDGWIDALSGSQETARPYKETISESTHSSDGGAWRSGIRRGVVLCMYSTSLCMCSEGGGKGNR